MMAKVAIANGFAVQANLHRLTRLGQRGQEGAHDLLNSATTITVSTNASG